MAFTRINHTPGILYRFAPAVVWAAAAAGAEAGG